MSNLGESIAPSPVVEDADTWRTPGWTLAGLVGLFGGSVINGGPQDYRAQYEESDAAFRQRIAAALGTETIPTHVWGFEEIKPPTVQERMEQRIRQYAADMALDSITLPMTGFYDDPI